MTASPPRVATGGTAQTGRPAIEETRAKQTLTADWNAVQPPPIEGLYLRDVKNVIYQNGVLTELFRREWFDREFGVGHVVYVSLLPGRTTQWHRHREQRDVVFPVRGTIRMGFHDGRESSITVGNSFVTSFNLARPRYVYIPPGVWHSLKNIGPDEAVYVVINDVTFDYEKPDDWVLPAGADVIPVRLD